MLNPLALAALVVTLTPALAPAAELLNLQADGNFLDSSPAANNGVNNNGVTFRTLAGSNQAFDFANGSYVSVPSLSGNNVPANLATTGFTVSAFFQVDTTYSLIAPSIVNLRDSANNGFTIEPEYNNPGSVLFYVRTSSSSLGQFISVPGFDIGTAHHAALVYDPANSTLAAYRDGVLAASITTTGTLTLSGNENFEIGRNAVTTTFNLDGYVDEVRFFNTPLTSTQVAALVPEPTTATLLLPLTLLLKRRR